MVAGLQTSIWNNNIRSIFLLALYPLIIMALIWAIAYTVAYSQGGFEMVRTDDATGTTWTNVGNPEYVANNIILEYWPIILAVIIIWFIISWFWNGAMMNALSNAHPVTRKEEPELYNLLENLCIAEGMKMPRLNIIETDAMNAFASGVDERSYSVTVTRGLIKNLQKDELEAVLGHELTHILNRDVRLMMVCVIFTGMVGFAAQLVWRSIRHGRWMHARGGRNKGGGVVLILAIAVILWIGYFATLFTRFALSRRREYMADAGSIKLTKNPEAMMRALMRISGKSNIPETPADVDMMCIENAQPFMGLFATHPPIEARIKTIAEMTGSPVPETGPAPANPWVRRG
ncbi:MAG: M48 family metallopeptidase [Alphaproteobacteria bacterium]|nr:M48 family metallopeptidase [Alphaproteobacteria bacterium]